MKIAAITDDGKTISQHFGRAEYYLAWSVKDGRITGQELCEEAGRHTLDAREILTALEERHRATHLLLLPHGTDIADAAVEGPPELSAAAIPLVSP